MKTLTINVEMQDGTQREVTFKSPSPRLKLAAIDKLRDIISQGLSKSSGVLTTGDVVTNLTTLPMAVNSMMNGFIVNDNQLFSFLNSNEGIYFIIGKQLNRQKVPAQDIELILDGMSHEQVCDCGKFFVMNLYGFSESDFEEKEETTDAGQEKTESTEKP